MSCSTLLNRHTGLSERRFHVAVPISSSIDVKITAHPPFGKNHAPVIRAMHRMWCAMISLLLSRKMSLLR